MIANLILVNLVWFLTSSGRSTARGHSAGFFAVFGATGPCGLLYAWQETAVIPNGDEHPGSELWIAEGKRNAERLAISIVTFSISLATMVLICVVPGCVFVAWAAAQMFGGIAVILLRVYLCNYGLPAGSSLDFNYSGLGLILIVLLALLWFAFSGFSHRGLTGNLG